MLDDATLQGKILLVDDDDEITQFVQDALEDEGFTVLIAHDGARAIELARVEIIDLVLLDIMLPHLDGFSVCQVLRDELDIPILFVSARQGESDRIQGLSVGGDDYIMKPFSIRELVARVRAHLRRENRLRKQKRQMVRLVCGALSIHLDTYEVRYREQLLALSRKEFEIVRLLALHPRQVFSRETIYERVWGDDANSYSETVTEHIKRVRRKLALADPHTEYIKTVWGVGYKWDQAIAKASDASF
ncbi:DNA-binding response OmpR family regulator [Thermosporothrix hazakensis]|jgi:DNA-binding response OmpR family regulator|uniref:DNA-binding response OmpR family regulator n=2 Tax=Thermosporothrix TaxID=768650 RepID=A0A326UDX8_THEHA|nr:response regulator transcription factor [Thermosporothrix hazakensis]PZW36627.1 DNA-binding response OmpR family regulator [Thermosporothrix hazakensis]BBH89095.1 DNA-binding response regulator [Thermosporothrix sp. COM3]GCE47278.1 DNA-binding response regulator [Thermosporothrix hazakensis]